MLIWHYLTKGESGLIGERHKTIFVATEHDRAAGPEGQGRSGGRRGSLGSFLSDLLRGSERNKMAEVLLRSPGKRVGSRPEGLVSRPGLLFRESRPGEFTAEFPLRSNGNPAFSPVTEGAERCAKWEAQSSAGAHKKNRLVERPSGFLAVHGSPERGAPEGAERATPN